MLNMVDQNIYFQKITTRTLIHLKVISSILLYTKGLSVSLILSLLSGIYDLICFKRLKD